MARVLRALGATVVDADELAREVVQPGQPAHADIAARWPEVVGGSGEIDRKRLGDIVFPDAAARAELNAITHPRIAQAGARLMDAARERGEPLVFYEAALIVENRLHEGMDGLVVVSAPEDLQVRRLRERNGLSETAARVRIAAQLPLAAKERVATHVLDNRGSIEELEKATRALYQELLAQTGTDRTEQT